MLSRPVHSSKIMDASPETFGLKYYHLASHRVAPCPETEVYIVEIVFVETKIEAGLEGIIVSKANICEQGPFIK